MANDFLGKECRSFFITDIPLLTFGIILSRCCLKLSFSSSIMPRCFWCDVLSTWILFRLMVGWFWICFFLVNKTSCAGLLGSAVFYRFTVFYRKDVYENSEKRVKLENYVLIFLEKKSPLGPIFSNFICNGSI